MKNKCSQCQKIRTRLISNYGFLIVINYIIRSYFELKTNTIMDLLFLPTVVTFAVAILLFIGANKKILNK